jgi:hypothetical protein
VERVAYFPTLLTGIALILFVLERFVPPRTAKTALLGRLVVDVCISAPAFIVAAAVVRPAALSALQSSSQTPFGLLHAVHLPTAVQVILGFFAPGPDLSLWAPPFAP